MIYIIRFLIILGLIPFSGWASSLKDSVKDAIKKNQLDQYIAHKQQVLKSKTQIDNAGNAIEVTGGVGNAAVGSYNGSYSEYELSYEFELSGEKASRKSKLLPIQLQILDTESIAELNQQKLILIKVLLSYKTILSKSEHAKERKQRLNKLTQYLTHYKIKSPQAKMNKELLQLKMEELAMEIQKLNSELKYFSILLDELFGENLKQKLGSDLLSNKFYQMTYHKIQNLPSHYKEINKLKLEALKVEREIAERSWAPDLGVYAGQNTQAQPDMKPQVTSYIGIGIKIPLDVLFSKKTKMAHSAQALEKIRQVSRDFGNKDKIKNLYVQIESKLHYLEAHNAKKLKQIDRSLIEFGKSLSKGLISIQSYLELEDQIHERLNTILNYKLNLFDDFYALLALKKSNFDIVEELE